MPLMLNVYNTTLEKWRRQFNSKGYTFEPRSLTKVPEEMEHTIRTEYAPLGLVILNPGDDLKSKEKEGLLNYLDFLNFRMNSNQLYLDEKKRNGVTVEEPRSQVQMKAWKKELIEILKLDEGYAPLTSFKDSPLDVNLFSGEMQVEEVVAKPRGRPKKSFTEVNIEDEVRV